MADARRDQNSVPTLIGVSSADGVTPVNVYVDPTTHRLLADIPSVGGDVVGPSSSTDNAVVRFDGTTGKLIQNSSATLSDAGNLSLGSPTNTNAGLRLSNTISGGTSAYGIFQDGIIQSGVTTDTSYNRTVASTAAAAFTLGTLYHYNATQTTLGAGSAITTQIGFNAESSLTGATNNYGFYGAIASGTGRYNLYMVGTANNYINGSLGLGTASPTSGFKLDIRDIDLKIRLESTTGTNSVQQRFTNTGGTFYTALDSSTGAAFGAAYGAALWHSGAYPILFATSNAERMRLDASGNLLIGTTVQVYSEKLAVVSDQNSSVYQVIRNSNSGASAASGLALNAYGNSWGIEIGSVAKNSNALTFSVDYLGSPAEKMRLTTGGNLGLGVAPSAWISSANVVDFVYPSVGMSNSGAGFLSFNAYVNSVGNWIYKTTDEANRFVVDIDGGFRWYTAPAGTAGNTITFTQVMTLNAGGNLLVGTTSATGLWSGSEKIVGVKGASSDAAGVQVSSSNAQNTTTELFASYGTSEGGIVVKGDSAHQATVFGSFNGATYAERMRISSDGNLGVGNASPNYKLDVSGTGHFTKTVSFDEYDNGNSGTSDTIDWTQGNKQKSTLTGNVTYTFTPPGSPTSLVFKLVQDATGSRTATWPASVKWSGGTAPTLTTTANRIDIITFYYDGTNYYGSASLNYTA